uniref:Putative secreted protein n=1 Tax=Anopheles marajoara TaxID=58244 RepID=A0A2M4C6W7_9DIPT
MLVHASRQLVVLLFVRFVLHTSPVQHKLVPARLEQLLQVRILEHGRCMDGTTVQREVDLVQSFSHLVRCLLQCAIRMPDHDRSLVVLQTVRDVREHELGRGECLEGSILRHYPAGILLGLHHRWHL